MHDPNHTVLGEACSPDADRAGTSASWRRPEWLVHVLALLALFLRRHLPLYRGLPSWWHDRPDLPLGSVQALAASIRGAFGNQIAWTCRRRGIGPGHPDWPELSRAIVAFGGSIKGFRPGLPPCGLQWWENPDIIPGMMGLPAATPAATATALLLARDAVVDTPPPARPAMPAEPEPAVSPAPQRPAVARVATGPPTGPPVRWITIPVAPPRPGPDHGQPRCANSCRSNIAPRA